MAKHLRGTSIVCKYFMLNSLLAVGIHYQKELLPQMFYLSVIFYSNRKSFPLENIFPYTVYCCACRPKFSRVKFFCRIKYCGYIFMDCSTELYCRTKFQRLKCFVIMIIQILILTIKKFILQARFGIYIYYKYNIVCIKSYFGKSNAHKSQNISFI